MREYLIYILMFAVAIGLAVVLMIAPCEDLMKFPASHVRAECLK